MNKKIITLVGLVALGISSVFGCNQKNIEVKDNPKNVIEKEVEKDNQENIIVKEVEGKKYEIKDLCANSCRDYIAAEGLIREKGKKDYIFVEYNWNFDWDMNIESLEIWKNGELIIEIYDGWNGTSSGLLSGFDNSPRDKDVDGFRINGLLFHKEDGKIRTYTPGEVSDEKIKEYHQKMNEIFRTYRALFEIDEKEMKLEERRNKDLDETLKDLFS